MQDRSLTPVMIVVLNGFADWETALIAGIGGGFYGLPVRYTTPGGGTVRSMGGLTVAGLADAQPRGDEIVVLCGSDAWTRPGAPDLSDMLHAVHDHGQTVAGICAGTLALARAGLLAGRAHTSNGLDFLRHHWPAYADSAQYRDQPQAVSDGGIITAPGTAPITFAAEIFTAAGLAPSTRDEFLAFASAEVQR